MSTNLDQHLDGSSRPAAGALDEAFAPLRRELLAHCYRMLGSFHDAEDAVQETYLRAWRSYSSFEGRSSVRTWLHRIATNVCLTMCEARKSRALPRGLGQERSDPRALLEQSHEIPWLEPFPGPTAGTSADPATATTEHARVRLALIAALQHLPARQRAALLMKEVLQWKASEIADALGTTTTSVNSSMQRARAHLAELALDEDTLAEPDDQATRELIGRYASALERKDIPAIVQMFTADAIWEMPPFVGWYQGPADIGALIDIQCPAGPGELSALPVIMNAQPALAVYIAAPGDRWEAFQIQVLDHDGQGRLAHAYVFFDTALFTAAGLPLALPGTEMQRRLRRA
ncbi:sigma-70 family RNA polymerase sigma factor [Hoyosella sp. G463]|uniref:Sigma-70 family RNA polymerase sigma factor n=1 Tax=Lolliginicoccus lacisalsi TaxID=2742202 RepID=A0A927PM22_9ACTN|nr:sigma-70 family RNA polymerase sigma factor [Lolliginicoccus lacisalsi]MBD8507785.1 sigma-70 family RNA polymerase sigma factor [Lolliginicoccus lacisalsi]